MTALFNKRSVESDNLRKEGEYFDNLRASDRACNLRGWLFAVADKKIKEARLNASRRKRELILEDIAESLRSESGELCPACELTRPLGEKDRELFEMIYERGMSHADISRALGVSDGALRVRICRLKAKLMKNIN